jgi:hypothetical protein
MFLFLEKKFGTSTKKFEVKLNLSRVSLVDKFKKYIFNTESFNPEDRGTRLGSTDVIRNAHNSFSSQESFVFDEDKSSKGKVNLKSI